MKKIVILGIILLLLIPVVSAQTKERSAGVTPDSVLYKLDVFFDNVKAALTSSPLGKAKVRLDIMQERMAEMEVMAVKNKTTEAKKAKLEGQKQMEKFESSVEKVKKKDANKLNEYMQTHAERFAMWKQRLTDHNLTVYADAMIEAIVLLETTENKVVNIPEDLDPDSTFIISSMCEDMGATTVEECNEMISGGFFTAKVGVFGHGERPPDPHNCSGYWASRETKWCCHDSDGKYSPEHIEFLLDLHPDFPPDDNYYFWKGTVEYKIINLKTGEIEQGIEEDSCNGDTLTEWICPRVMNRETRNERYSEEYDCPYGCEDGKCLICNLDSFCDQKEDCSCSDCEGKKGDCPGLDFYCQDGECVYEQPAIGLSKFCLDSDDGQDYSERGTINSKEWESDVQKYIDTCMDDSRLGEGYCVDSEMIIEGYLCPNGCEDGVCIL
ncbi:hypothetical protein HQ533_03760 [Candidatus Woesearchaeota archaeon]|nr:hypothetical protein [Candidatus Woesearchaeota archaeon]